RRHCPQLVHAPGHHQGSARRAHVHRQGDRLHPALDVRPDAGRATARDQRQDQGLLRALILQVALLAGLLLGPLPAQAQISSEPPPTDFFSLSEPFAEVGIGAGVTAMLAGPAVLAESLLLRGEAYDSDHPLGGYRRIPATQLLGVFALNTAIFPLA